MGLGIGRKLKKELKRGEKRLRKGVKDITGQRNMDKSREAQKKANMLQRKRAQLQLTRDRRQLAAGARVAQAQNLMAALASGGGFSSSAFRGVESSIGSDVATRIGEAQQDFAFTTAIQQHESRAAAQASKGQEKSGLFSTGVSIGSSLFSDPRLKDGVHKVGKKNGFNIYSWTWNDLAERMFGLVGVAHGVMAHEIAGDYPDAISYEDGYMKVDYSMLGL